MYVTLHVHGCSQCSYGVGWGVGVAKLATTNSLNEYKSSSYQLSSVLSRCKCKEHGSARFYSSACTRLHTNCTNARETSNY